MTAAKFREHAGYTSRSTAAEAVVYLGGVFTAGSGYLAAVVTGDTVASSIGYQAAGYLAARVARNTVTGSTGCLAAKDTGYTVTRAAGYGSLSALDTGYTVSRELSQEGVRAAAAGAGCLAAEAVVTLCATVGSALGAASSRWERLVETTNRQLGFYGILCHRQSVRA